MIGERPLHVKIHHFAVMLPAVYVVEHEAVLVAARRQLDPVKHNAVRAERIRVRRVIGFVIPVLRVIRPVDRRHHITRRELDRQLR